MCPRNCLSTLPCSMERPFSWYATPPRTQTSSSHRQYVGLAQVKHLARLPGYEGKIR